MDAIVDFFDAVPKDGLAFAIVTKKDAIAVKLEDTVPRNRWPNKGSGGVLDEIRRPKALEIFVVYLRIYHIILTARANYPQKEKHAQKARYRKRMNQGSCLRIRISIHRMEKQCFFLPIGIFLIAY